MGMDMSSPYAAVEATQVTGPRQVTLVVSEEALSAEGQGREGT